MDGKDGISWIVSGWSCARANKLNTNLRWGAITRPLVHRLKAAAQQDLAWMPGLVLSGALKGATTVLKARQGPMRDMPPAAAHRSETSLVS